MLADYIASRLLRVVQLVVAHWALPSSFIRANVIHAPEPYQKMIPFCAKCLFELELISPSLGDPHTFVLQ